MKGHLKEEQVVPYLDGRLASEEQAAVERHLTACAECRTRIKDLRGLLGVLDEWRGAEVSPGFPAAVRQRIEAESAGAARSGSWRWVYAGALAVAAAVLLVIIVQPPVPEPTGLPAEVTQTPEETAEEMALVEPVVLENYELLRDFDLLFEPPAEKKPPTNKQGT